MPSELTMPKLSDSMERATIIRWLKAPGEPFERGAELVEIETDKATVVYEAEDDGILRDILVPEGSLAAVGDPIATLAGEGVSAPNAPENGAPVSSPSRSAPPASVPPAPAGGSVTVVSRPRATPVARRTALELGLSLHGLRGTGHGGRITRSDVRRAFDQGFAHAPVDHAPSSGTGAVEVVELTATQTTIAQRMIDASTVPVFTAAAEIDVTALIDLRAQAREHSLAVPSLNDFVVKAVGLALRVHPEFNATFVDGRILRHSRVNVSIAVAGEGTLLVPTLFDADRKSVGAISIESRALADAARARSLTPAQLSDGTFTVSNLGMFGISSFTAIIHVPQVSILAVGGVSMRVTETESRFETRHLMTVTLTSDHRAIYGADAGRFLATLRDRLERPLSLLLETAEAAR